jgi:universal stress protein E
MAIKILVAVNPGHTESPAIERARALARATEVDVLLYSAIYDAQLSSLRTGEMEGIRAAMVDAERVKLAEIQEDLALVAKSVEVETQWSYPIAVSINAAAVDFGAHFIIASTTQHSALARLVLTNMDWSLIRQAKIPVLFAHHQPFQEYTTVLAAVDPTHAHDEPAELDTQLINAGNRFASLFDGELHIGHAYPSGSTVISPEYVIPPAVFVEWQDIHTSAVNQLAQRHGIEPSRVHLVDEPPAKAIVDLAQSTGAQLVVLGAISRSFMDRAVTGRTTERLLDQIQCDVLTVPAGAEIPVW